MFSFEEVRSLSAGYKTFACTFSHDSDTVTGHLTLPDARFPHSASHDSDLYRITRLALMTARDAVMPLKNGTPHLALRSKLREEILTTLRAQAPELADAMTFELGEVMLH